MPTIKGKSTMLFLLRDIILKIRLKKIKKIRKTASLMFPFQFTKHTCEKLNFFLSFYFTHHHRIKKFGNTPITASLPYK